MQCIVQIWALGGLVHATSTKYEHVILYESIKYWKVTTLAGIAARGSTYSHLKNKNLEENQGKTSEFCLEVICCWGLHTKQWMRLLRTQWHSWKVLCPCAWVDAHADRKRLQLKANNDAVQNSALILRTSESKQVWTSEGKLESFRKKLWQGVMEVCLQWVTMLLSSMCCRKNKRSVDNQRSLWLLDGISSAELCRD